MKKTLVSTMDRRAFLGAGVSLAAVAGCRAIEPGVGSVQPVAPSGGVVPPESPANLIASAPVLQNAAETSMGVAFAVTADASGWVEYGEKSDLSDAQRAWSGGGGMTEVDDRVAQVRLRGLKPATRYYYRIGADRISYKGGYAMKNLGSETDGRIHAFTTLGKTASGRFCVIQDTHESVSALDACFGKIAALKPSAVIWNGDASNTTETREHAMRIFLTPHEKHPEYAADTPYLFVNGNHDFRGRFNRHLERVVMFRDPAERAGEYAELGRNFVQRLGDICLIGLDTGEDKLDTNPVFAKIFRMQAYRELQAKWLAQTVESEAVKTAKWKVVFCHIPLFDANPRSNPGDIAPADSDPRYSTDFAAWQRTCANLWSPSFVKAGVQLVIAAHEHTYRYDAPTADRPWAQIVGGGPDVGPRANDRRFATVIEGGVEGGQLVVRVHDVSHDRLVRTFTF